MSTDALDAADGASDAPSLRRQAQVFWRSRAPRERQALGIGAVLLVLVLAWLVLVQPAWHTVREAPAQLDRLERELQQIEATAVEVKNLRAVPPVSSTQAAAALKAATERLGSGARLALQGDRATVTFTGVGSEALRSWLGEARSAARARPVEASLARAAQGYSGTISVTLGGVQ
ncbi:MAG: type II secretion system protein GspM [Caldimonas sp.]